MPVVTTVKERDNLMIFERDTYVYLNGDSGLIDKVTQNGVTMKLF